MPSTRRGGRSAPCGRASARGPCVWGALLAAFALVLDFAPLFDVLGYDFSFALGFGAALAAVDVGQGTVARWRLAGRRSHGRRDGAAGRAGRGDGAGPAGASAAPFARQRAPRPQLQPGRRARLFRPPAGGDRPSSPRRPGRWPAWLRHAAGGCWPSRCRWSRSSGPSCGSIATRPCSPSIRSGATSQGRSTTRRCGRRLPWSTSALVNLVWIATAVAIGAAADRLRLRSAPLAAPALLVGPAALGGVARALSGRGPPRLSRRSRRPEARARSQLHHRTLRRALRGARARARPTSRSTGEDLEFRYQQLRDTLGVEPKLPITVWEFPSRRGQEGARRRRPHAVRASPGRERSSSRAIASRRGACATRWPTCSPAPSAIRCSGWRWPGGSTGPCPCRRWRPASSRGSPRRRPPAIPTATPPSTRRRRR